MVIFCNGNKIMENKNMIVVMLDDEQIQKIERLFWDAYRNIRRISEDTYLVNMEILQFILSEKIYPRLHRFDIGEEEMKWAEKRKHIKNHYGENQQWK